MWEHHSEDGAVLWATILQFISLSQRCLGLCFSWKRKRIWGVGGLSCSISCSWDESAGNSKFFPFKKRHLQQCVNLGWLSCVWRTGLAVHHTMGCHRAPQMMSLEALWLYLHPGGFPFLWLPEGPAAARMGAHGWCLCCGVQRRRGVPTFGYVFVLIQHKMQI